ncbi:SDR family NAD(P)-dependent oxidoreductase [Fictibacillus fluitans]|uniref:SDR family oxidoreductase n=1 Tax=Fictibacillus fluitans TaxID=3058422 RepID=A0ABT8HRE0_9BACL|nr:SDR family oxidoreductase [Fictibacillus sp. NE201]MDN4523314.1 SDR family oxidoreductase [Fictibacillus sp. NE201]
MLLKNKNTVIYGAGGAIGGSVARAFAEEGAKVFIAGRTLTRLNVVAKEITDRGGVVETAQVNALDEQAVENHLSQVVKTVGSVDVAFNLIGLGETQGAPLVEMEQEQFVSPIATAMQTHFITATAAARHMAKQKAGVILALTAQAARKPYRDVGGFGVAGAAIEGFCRQLAIEVGPLGIRVVCLRSAGSPDAPGVDEVFRRHADNARITREDFEAGIAEKTLLKRLPRLAEVANAAVLMASDRASAITGAVANVTCGEIVD